MEEQHRKFMEMAIRLSEQNVKGGLGGPFGAVVVKDGQVVAKSANVVTSTLDPTAHAEVAAIRLACKKLKTFDLSGCVIYASCEPCPMCLGAIYWSRISELHYANTKSDAKDIGFDDQFIYEEIDRPASERRLRTRQLMRDEALQAFRLWKESDIRIEY